VKALLVCSTGGHLAQLMRMRPWWGSLDRAWVTFDRPDARRLAGETVYFASWPVTRSLPKLVRNTAQAWRVLRRERPDVVVSNGAGVAVPYFVVARVLGIPSIWIEVYDRIDTASMTGRIVRRLASKVVLQWESQLAMYPNGVVLGPVL